MKFTFGIISVSERIPSPRLDQILASIRNECPETNYEIIVVGGNETKVIDGVQYISFDETIKPNWITKKKNIITSVATHENIVYMHDQIALGKDWYKSMVEFGNDWNVLMTQMINLDGSRYRDWTLCPYEENPPWCMQNLLPYNVLHLSRKMYISGAQFLAKKTLMNQFPLDESLSWGEGEDVLWSYKVRKYHHFSLNSNAKVYLLVQKNVVFSNATMDKINNIQINL